MTRYPGERVGVCRRGVESVLTRGRHARHLTESLDRRPAAHEDDASDPEPDEEHAEEIARGAASDSNRLGEERDPQRDRDEPEREDRAAVQAGHAARSRGVATITRHGAWRRTKSTASPKIWRRPRCNRTRRGPAMTMISELRRIASSTMARPMLRVRAMPPITVTPYQSPIAPAPS